MLWAINPIVATYARVEAVDVRISAVAVETMSAEALVETAAGIVQDKLGSYVWATGETTWSDAIGARLGGLGWTLAVVEIGTAGSIAALFGDAAWLRFDESIAPGAPAATAHVSTDGSAPDSDAHEGPDSVPDGPDPADETAADDLIRYARRAPEPGGADV